jgi:formylglycine-generating enzyme
MRRVAYAGVAATVIALLSVRCAPSGDSRVRGNSPEPDVVSAPDVGPGITDSGVDGPGAEGLPDACSVMVPSEGCVHPTVNASCDGGWCFIPKGCFVMGSPPCEWGRGAYSENENETRLTHDFWIKQTEVTQADWTAVGLPNPSGIADSGRGDCDAGDCPLGNVSWYEALAFANQLSARDGLAACYTLTACNGAVGAGMACSDAGASVASLYECAGYRLPTEAEWEYAARAGTRTAFYSGEVTPQASRTDCFPDTTLDQIAWYCANTPTRTQPVGKKVPNAWGLYDMSGNAFELVTDPFRGNGYGTVPRTDPGAQLESDPFAVWRGGQAFVWSSLARSAHRHGPIPRSARAPGTGFRLVRKAD